MSKLKPFIFAVLSGVFLSLAFPNFNFTFLAWAGFVCLFLATRNCSLKKTFFLWYAGGIVFYALTIYWVIHVTLIGLILLVVYLAVYFGLFGILTKKLERFPKILFLFLTPAVWIALEYIRSHFLSGFGWVLLGYSQSSNLAMIQIADCTGVYGVSYAVMLVNVLLYFSIRDGLGKNTKEAVAVFLVISVLFAYGIFKLRQTTKAFSKIKIALIQGNIPQDVKWEESKRDFILRTYEVLTKKAGEEKPDLIIWPETSVPGYLEAEPDLLGRVTALAKETGTSLLVGSIGYDFENYGKPFNSAILIKDSGRNFERHNKLHLVPFGEYIPFENIFGFIRSLIEIGDFKAGKEYGLLSIKDAKLGTLVCFENIFGSIVRNFIKKGANCMVNITNDAWFKNSSAPFQHAQGSIFRAVENRVYVVGCANTGLSCFIDEKGRLYNQVRDAHGKSIEVAGVCISEVGLLRSDTFYTRFGDLFAFICLVLSISVLILPRFKPVVKL
ncbi:MAG: apolipoprotein N-acyltransferase [Candidatus Omnitrophota bacterium]